MRKTIFTLAIMMMASGALITSCNTPAEKVENSKENVEQKQRDLDKAKQELAENYRQFKLESENEIAANDQMITDLRQDSKKRTKEEKIKYDEQINDLEVRNERMKEKINTHRQEDNEKWESFKREFKHDMKELKGSLQDLGKNNVK